MFSERGFIRPDIEVLGRSIQERDSIVVGKRGCRRPTLFCVKQEEGGLAGSSVGPCVISRQMFVKSEFLHDSALVCDSD